MTTDPQSELERLRKRVERERRARQEAEALAEQGTRQLYERNRQMQLLYTIADASARAATVQEALQVAINELCGYMEWPLGHAFLVNSDPAQTLVSAALWYEKQPELTQDFRLESERLTFRRGEGLPGRVVEAGAPVWVRDVTMDDNFPRAPRALEIGLRGAFAIPVLVGKAVVAVLEFFSREFAEPDESWVCLAGQIGTQVGRIFEREARNAADRANQAKSEFLSRMSHELRTPLNAILGFGQLLVRDDLSARQLSGVEFILKGGRHLLSLIDEVLDISRIESGNLNLSLEPVAVLNVLSEVLDLIRPLAAQRSLPVEVREDREADVYVLADRQRLRQVLLNLLSNAVKYNRDGGSVIVRCECVQGRIRLSVTDMGAGIATHKLPLLFTPFERLGAEQSTVEGTGLGLALSRRLTEVMGGTMGVESEQGQGSTFWIELSETRGPLEEASDSFLSLDDPPAPSGPPSLILYIEDNFSNLQLVENILLYRPNLKLISAMRASQGIALAADQQPEIILLDLNLPETHGHEVLLQLRANPRTRDIPVVIVSADATPGQVRRLLAAGAHAYLTKPIDLTQFLKTLDDLLEAKAEASESPADALAMAQ